MDLLCIGRVEHNLVQNEQGHLPSCGMAASTRMGSHDCYNADDLGAKVM
jgi:hypothetical protein